MRIFNGNRDVVVRHVGFERSFVGELARRRIEAEHHGGRNSCRRRCEDNRPDFVRNAERVGFEWLTDPKEQRPTAV
ncbi:hypothetical protein D3C87_1912450 [compost metagenome]